MKPRFISLPSAAALLFWIVLGTFPVLAQNQVKVQLNGSDVSFRNELQNSIDRGVRWLLANQNSNGWWSTPDHTAVTALALTALHGEPSGRFKQQTPPQFDLGYQFLLSQVKPDGGIYVRELTSYNTSLSMVALLTAPKGNHDKVVSQARKYLVSLQEDRGVKGRLDTPFDGGIGYGGIQKDPDVNNTFTALQALHYSRHLLKDQGSSGAKDLQWDSAIHFLQNCQNLPEHNSQNWVSKEPRDRGGFIYHPGRSMAGGETNAATGKISLRSYGSISYAGLLSYIYADLKQDDPKVTAVLTWLKDHYTLEENPGMGKQGLYYYYHLMAKALSAAKVEELQRNDGTKVNWRQELALKLIELQKEDGSWANTNARWWEKDSSLVTAYSLITLETLWRSL